MGLPIEVSRQANRTGLIDLFHTRLHQILHSPSTDPAHVAAVVIVPEAVVSHVPVAIGHDHSRAPVHGADRIVHVPIRKAHDPTEVGPSREILVKSSNVDQTAVAPASHRRDPIHNLHPDHHQSHIPAMELTISGSHLKYDPRIHKLDEDEAIRQHHFASSTSADLVFISFNYLFLIFTQIYLT